MQPLKTSQFAEIYIIGEGFVETDPMTTQEPILSDEERQVKLVKVGFANSLRISEDLGSTQVNVIGTPVPIFAPGYYQGNITADKATIDLKSWKTMVSINPYMAFRPDSYDRTGAGSALGRGLNFSDVYIGGEDFSDDLSETNGFVPRFLFGMFVYDTILDAPSKPTGLYICMLRSYNTALSSNDAIIMEDVNILARPVRGSWFAAIKQWFTMNPAFGYVSSLKPQRGS